MPEKQNKRILIAEDDPFLGKIMQFSLGQEGYEIDRALDGGEALEKIIANNYAVVLLDLIMPVKDGFEVLSELKKLKNKTPVLVFSNLAQEEDKKEVLSLGAKGYYVKSHMAISELVKVINKFTK
jgi:DNA-binding response OmpR family regulator